MSDLESYLTHCYDLLLNKTEDHDRKGADEEERCACANLIDHQDSQNSR